MQTFLIACAVSVLLFASTVTALDCKGCVSLDEHSFKKVVPRFKVALVKFDVAYPYGDKHDTFVKFANEQLDNQDFLLAEVGVKEYGEKENQEFAAKQAVDPKKLPAIKLYKGDESVLFDQEITIQNLRRFVVTNSNLHLSLPGCLEAQDKLALKFTTATDKESLLKEAEQLLDGLQSDDVKTTAKVYVTFMKKIIENGSGFVKTEMRRLDKLIKDGKMLPKKKEDLEHRLNILNSFKVQDKKEEL